MIRSNTLRPGKLRPMIEQGFLAALAAEDWGETFFVEVRLERKRHIRRTLTRDGVIAHHSGERRRLSLVGCANVAGGHWEIELEQPIDEEIVIPGLGRPSPTLLRRLHKIARASWEGGLQTVVATLMTNAETGALAGNFADLTAHDLLALAGTAESWGRPQ